MNKLHFTAERPSIETRRRTLIHPGRYNPVRIHLKHTSLSKHLRLTLQPHANFHDAIVNPLREMGIENAMITMFGGFFDRAYYCIAPPDPLKRAVIAYSDPVEADKSYMVAGNATLGKNIHGEPLIHCHAALLTSDNRMRGGHIIVDRCVIGPKPVFAHVVSLQGINVVQKWDAETNILLLQPQLPE